ncbi:MAG: hypothetical protein F6J92_21590 [Symploca sp. SIO1A3]|nr:hypothetical protein [Symploca sp. SIO1A3]
MKKRVVLSGSQEQLKAQIPLIIEIHELLADIRAKTELLATRGTSTNAKYRPKIQLYFYHYDVMQAKSYDAQLSCYLMDEKISTITIGEVKALATIIEQKFAKPIFKFKKGTRKVMYSDVGNGYFNPYVLAETRAEGIRVLNQFLEIRNIPFDMEKVGYVENGSPATRYSSAGTELLMGEAVERLVERPNVEVKFRHAQLFLGKRKAITLVDTSGKLPPPPFDLE